MDDGTPPPAPPAAPRLAGVRASGRAAPIGLALAAALALKVALHAALPGPFDPLARAKLLQLDRRRDAIDTIFLGSSRTYRGVSPAAFDAATAAAGAATRSYNLGMPGLGPLELDFLLDRIAAHRPPELRWIFVECGDLGFEHDWRNEDTERVSYWHDAPRTGLALASVAHQRDPWRKRAQRAQLHVRAFFHDVLELGRGSRALMSLATSGHADVGDPTTLGPRRDGFRSFDAELVGADAATRDHLAASREALLRDRTGFESTVRALAQHRGNTLALDPDLIAMFARARAKIERMGAHALFVVPPMRTAHASADAAEKQGVFPVLLRFNEPGRYPGLFAFERWWDATHFDERGALLYTRALAERFAAYARAPGSPP